MRINLGPAGSPGRSTLEGIGMVREMGLQAMEVQFTHGMKMSNETAKEVGEEAKRLGVELSVHAPYFINLASHEKPKVAASRNRILGSCERAHHMGAENVVFHPAFYGKHEKGKVFEIVAGEVSGMMDVIKERGWKTTLAPETTGKVSQFGGLEEMVRLVKEAGCGICVDFAHLYARNRGVIDYAKILDALRPLKLKRLHCHFSNINFGLSGERNHLVLNSKPPFEPLASEILKRKLDITIISESPITWRDSIKMRKIFEKMGYKF